jgi:plasmid stabilization system protein ParE
MPEAENDRAQIFDYIAADSPRSAIKMDKLFNRGF